MNGSKLSKVPIYTNLITPCPAIGDITNIEVWRSAKNKQRERKLNKRRRIVNSTARSAQREPPQTCA